MTTRPKLKAHILVGFCHSSWIFSLNFLQCASILNGSIGVCPLACLFIQFNTLTTDIIQILSDSSYQIWPKEWYKACPHRYVSCRWKLWKISVIFFDSALNVSYCRYHCNKEWVWRISLSYLLVSYPFRFMLIEQLQNSVFRCYFQLFLPFILIVFFIIMLTYVISSYSSISSLRLWTVILHRATSVRKHILWLLHSLNFFFVSAPQPHPFKTCSHLLLYICLRESYSPCWNQ